MNAPESSGSVDIAPALAELPLFPLTQAVLMPGAMLPLHVFEPRYRTMVRDVLETKHRCLCVVMVTDPERLDADGHPTIAEIAGVGTIVDHVELPGGRINILVRGRARVRLRELPFVSPYRRASATLLPSPAGPAGCADVAALVSAATAFASLLRERDPSLSLRLPKNAAPGLLADLCTHALVLDPRQRQAILETLDPAARVRRVAEVLMVQRLALSDGSRRVAN